MPVQKSKWKRTVVGSILKSKDDTKPNYLKVNLYKQEEIVLKNGQSLQVLSKNFKLKDLQRLRQEGKLDDATLDKMEEQANKMPDFVMAEVVLLERN